MCCWGWHWRCWLCLECCLVIEISNLTFTYPERENPALQNISLQVDEGEFVLLAGESGCGKSTLMRCLNGLIPHLSGGAIQGDVVVHGLHTLHAGPQQMSQHVGFVFQNPEAQAVLDQVEPEIAFSLENSSEFQVVGKESKAEATSMRQKMQARVSEVIDLLNLNHLRQRPLRTLSGGERQKVALASALVLRPKLLVLDEPTSQLDPEAAADLMELLIKLNQEHGYTIILAEHRLERVWSAITRVVYLENGNLVWDAPPEEAIASLPYSPVSVDTAVDLTPAALTSTPVLSIESLSFAYGQTPVLESLSLNVGAGELVALMGPNGAGKSTLLRCVVGLLPAETGSVMINGRSTQNRSISEICREVAYLPQNPDDLLFADSVTEELLITLRNHNMAPDEAVAARFLTQLGLADVQSNYPRDLSVGQRQRVALGAVTVTEPALILLDEPTRGLDFAAKATMIAIWEQWLAQGKAILLVTHDVALVAKTAHRVVQLDKSKGSDKIKKI